MFRIVMYALWSEDFLAPLTRVLEKAYGCDYDQARAYVREIGGPQPLEVMAETPAKAYGLATRLMQYGVYTQVDQLGPVSDAVQVQDALAALPDKTSGWYIFREGRGGPVRRIVERETLISLRYEREVVTEAVGTEMLKRSAREIGAGKMAALEKKMLKERPVFEAMEAERLAWWREQTTRKGSTGPMWAEEEE